jgi:hypothetical protein
MADLLKHLENQDTPTDTIKLYCNQGIRYAIAKKNREINHCSDPDKVKVLEAELEKLFKQAEDNALVFNLRGVNSIELDALTEKAVLQFIEKYPEDDDRKANASELAVDQINRFISAHIVSIDGFEDTDTSPEGIAKLKIMLGLEEFSRLHKLCNQLSIPDQETTDSIIDFLSSN